VLGLSDSLPPLREGAPGVLFALSPEGIALDPGLLGPGLHHPGDARWVEDNPALVGLALDRWRRTSGAVLEALLLWKQARMQEISPGRLPLSWWNVGFAAEQIDRAAPHLGWLWPEAADLLRLPQQGVMSAPRRAAWYFRWRSLLEQDGARRLSLNAPAVPEERWLQFGEWCRDRARGPSGQAPLQLPLASPSTALRWTAAPMSHHPVALQAGPGGLFHGGAHLRAALSGGEQRTVVAGALAGGAVTLRPRVCGPLGTWTLLDGSIGGRVGAARGIEISFRDDGRLQVTLADAFAGPPTGDILGLADRFGVSGEGWGRWRVSEARGEGSGSLILRELEVGQVTLHPRRRHRFALPAENWMGPVRRVLEMLDGAPLTFEITRAEGRETLALRGEVSEREICLNLRRGSGWS